METRHLAGIRTMEKILDFISLQSSKGRLEEKEKENKIKNEREKICLLKN